MLPSGKNLVRIEPETMKQSQERSKGDMGIRSRDTFGRKSSRHSPIPPQYTLLEACTCTTVEGLIDHCHANGGVQV